MKKTNWLITFSVICLIFIGCQEKTSPDTAQKPQADYQKNFGLGGAPIEVVVELEKTQVEIVDFLNLKISLKYKESVRPVPLLLPPSVYEPLLLAEKPLSEENWEQSNGFIQQNWFFKFEPIISGKMEIKPLTIYFRLEKERPRDQSNWPVYKIVTEKVPYEVIASKIDDKAKIIEVWEYILPPYKWLYLISSILVCLLIGSGYFALQWYIRRQEPQLIGKNSPDYYQLALSLLQELDVETLIKNREVEQLHTQLSQILRDYLENCFNLKAKEQTTEEFVRDISYSNYFSGEQRNLLQQFLRLADLVKFATFEPDSDVSRGAYKSVENFIINTGNHNGI